MSRDFIIKYEEIERLEKTFNKELSNLIIRIDDLAVTINRELIHNESFTGATAEAVKAYFEEVHLTLLDDLKTTAQSLLENVTSYKAGYSSIDSEDRFILDKEVMADFRQKMYEDACEVYEHTAQINSILASISDIFPCGSVSAHGVLDGHEKIRAHISNLSEEVEAYEAKTVTHFNETTGVMLDNLKKSFEKAGLCSKNMLTYQPGTFPAHNSFGELIQPESEEEKISLLDKMLCKLGLVLSDEEVEVLYKTYASVFEGMDIKGMMEEAGLHTLMFQLNIAERVIFNCLPEEWQSFAESYVKRELEQVVYGNFTDEVNLGGTFCQFVMGFFNVDVPCDIRDIGADIYKLSNGEEVPAWQVALDAVAFFPLVGCLKSSDEVGIVLKNAPKNIDDIKHVIKNFLGNRRGWELAFAGIDDLPDLNDVSDAIKDAPKLWDKFVQFAKRLDASNYKDVNKVLDRYENMVKELGGIPAEKLKELGKAVENGLFNPDEIRKISKKMADLNMTEPFEEAMKKIDFKKYLTNLIGEAPEWMIDPHAHHILFKEGLGAGQKKLVDEGQAILRKFGIDPILGTENLIWAPMRVTGQHSKETLEELVDALKRVEIFGKGYDDIVAVLKEFGEIASERM